MDSTQFEGSSPWDALDLLNLDTATVRLHWTDQPYHWHVNDGPEAFVVLDGQIDMHYRESGVEQQRRLSPGMICLVESGDEHVAHPVGIARILVVEQAGTE
nr:cupin domain-containing protein [Ferrimicrobium sp.]